MKRSEAKAEAKEQQGLKGIGVANLFPDGMEGPSMGAGYGRVLERLFSLDPFEAYQDLERFLDGLGRRPSELTYPQIADELEQVETHAWRAARLLAHAQDARDAYERDCEVEEGAWRANAREALEAAKAAGQFTKTITNGDVEAYVATHFTAEYKALANRRSKAKRMVEAIERGADLLRRRRETLDTLTKGAR